jgi:hypothetical protein
VEMCTLGISYQNWIIPSTRSASVKHLSFSYEILIK